VVGRAVAVRGAVAVGRGVVLGPLAVGRCVLVGRCAGVGGRLGVRGLDPVPRLAVVWAARHVGRLGYGVARAAALRVGVARRLRVVQRRFRAAPGRPREGGRLGEPRVGVGLRLGRVPAADNRVRARRRHGLVVVAVAPAAATDRRGGTRGRRDRRGTDRRRADGRRRHRSHRRTRPGRPSTRAPGGGRRTCCGPLRCARAAPCT
jgi:hypothetical protein